MPRTAKPTGPKVFDWEATKVRTFIEWEISLPERGTPLWTELVVLLMERPDMDHVLWPTELIVTALILDAEKFGDVEHDYGYKYYDHQSGEAKFRILARVRQVPHEHETVYDPAHWKIALEPTELEVRLSPVMRIAAGLERSVHLPNEVSREDAIRNFVGELNEYVLETYGS